MLVVGKKKVAVDGSGLATTSDADLGGAGAALRVKSVKYRENSPTYKKKRSQTTGAIGSDPVADSSHV